MRPIWYVAEQKKQKVENIEIVGVGPGWSGEDPGIVFEYFCGVFKEIWKIESSKVKIDQNTVKIPRVHVSLINRKIRTNTY